MTTTPALSIFVLILITAGVFPFLEPETTQNNLWTDIKDDVIDDITTWIEEKISDSIRIIEDFFLSILYTIQDFEDTLLSLVFDPDKLEAEANAGVWTMSLALIYAVLCVISIFWIIRIYTFILDVVPVI